MTAEAQRIAIAEACGWTNCGPRFGRGNVICGYAPTLKVGETDKHRCDSNIPDYPNDLNAMHEAINSQSAAIRDRYKSNLAQSMCKNSKADSIDCLLEAIDATAAQRAEAFLKTIGKWQD